MEKPFVAVATVCCVAAVVAAGVSLYRNRQNGSRDSVSSAASSYRSEVSAPAVSSESNTESVISFAESTVSSDEDFSEESIPEESISDESDHDDAESLTDTSESTVDVHIGQFYAAHMTPDNSLADILNTAQEMPEDGTVNMDARDPGHASLIKNGSKVTDFMGETKDFMAKYGFSPSSEEEADELLAGYEWGYLSYTDAENILIRFLIQNEHYNINMAKTECGVWGIVLENADQSAYTLQFDWGSIGIGTNISVLQNEALGNAYETISSDDGGMIYRYDQVEDSMNSLIVNTDPNGAITKIQYLHSEVD